MTALFANGAMAGYLTFYDVPPDNGYREEPVLVLGFDDSQNPICIDAEGLVERRSDFTQLYLDWRWVPDQPVHGEPKTGVWMTTAEVASLADATPPEGE